MNRKKHDRLLKVSVVIPAYNEGTGIKKSIEALLAQTVAPYEILVVDNNSSDNTADIVAEYGERVTLLSEPKQGVMYARLKGLNTATGDILARTDADSAPEPDWIEKIIDNINKGATAALTGPYHYNDMPAPAVGGAVETTIRKELDRFSRSTRFLAGANMAVTRAAWRAVEPHLCQDTTIHEDLDIAIHLHRLGYKIAFIPDLVVGTSARRLDAPLLSFRRYLKVYEHTYNVHGIYSVTLKVPIMIYFPLYPILKIMRRAYNSETKQFSLRKLLNEMRQPPEPPADVTT